MTREPPAERTSFLRTAAPAITLVGLVMLGTSLFLTGIFATDHVVAELRESGPASVANGTATLTYAIAGEFTIPFGSYIEGSWRFPVEAGDAYVLDCVDYEELLATGSPGPDASAFPDRQQDSVRIPVEMVLRPFHVVLTEPPPPERPIPPGLRSPYCPGLYAVFQWPAEGEGWMENKPEVEVRIVRGPILATPMGRSLLGLAAVGAVVALGGGLAWRQERLTRVARSDAASEESTAETLLLLTTRSEDWLVRTRRYLIIAGGLGIFLWYPLLVPWAWQLGEKATFSAWAPPAFAGGALVLLLGLTAIWAREFQRIDRELREWRERLARLRQREERLLAELER